MAQGPDEMDDATWELVQKYLGARMTELKQTDNAFAFQLLKLDWAVLSDVPRMQRVVDLAELGQLKAARDTHDVQRPTMDARIAELEEATSEER